MSPVLEEEDADDRFVRVIGGVCDGDRVKIFGMPLGGTAALHNGDQHTEYQLAERNGVYALVAADVLPKLPDFIKL